MAIYDADSFKQITVILSPGNTHRLLWLLELSTLK